ncbi:MAG: hypothetical protein CO042_02985, partial [Parcubacteria group bacterium CG_4_9_14_0_2_um_filter_41_8]
VKIVSKITASGANARFRRKRLTRKAYCNMLLATIPGPLTFYIPRHRLRSWQLSGKKLGLGAP